MATFQTLQVSIENAIAHIIINRPEKANALNQTAWQEIGIVFEELSHTNSVRVIVLEGGESKHFCAGIDLSLLMSISQMMQGNDCQGRKREKLRQEVFALQAPINAIENCTKPVLVAIHGGCIGGGVDIVCAADMRYSTNDAFFTIKEIDMGMVADLGTLQRLPKLIADGIVRELAYTGRNMGGIEAQKHGLVNQTFETKKQMMQEVMAIASQIASKSPLSIRGTKEMIRYTRDHSVADSLNYIATWNAAMLISADLTEAFQAQMQKRKAVFED